MLRDEAFAEALAAHPHETHREGCGRFLNVRLRVLPNVLDDSKPGFRVCFEARGVMREARLWGLDPWGPERAGTYAWAQVELAEASPFHAEQRFVLRSANAPRVVAGGVVLDLAPDAPRNVTAAERSAYGVRLADAASVETGLAAYAAEVGAAILNLDALARRWMCAPSELVEDARRTETLCVAGGAEHTLCWRRAVETRVLSVLRPSVEAAPRAEQFAAYEHLRGVSGLPIAHLPLLLETAFTRDTPHARFLRENARVDPSGLTIYPGV